MTTGLTTYDGFDDEANEADNIIQGELVKFIDGRWLNRGDGTAFPDVPLIAFDVKKALQCWEEQTPIETIIQKPGEPLPDVDDLNARIPQSQWELGLNGKPKPPWQLVYVVYLLNPVDASTYTSINSTAGQRRAYYDLCGKIARMRALRGCRVVPVVRLSSALMKTDYGAKMRPEFKIVEWRELGPARQAMPDSPVDGAVPQPQSASTKLISKPKAPSAPAADFDDDLPF